MSKTTKQTARYGAVPAIAPLQADLAAEINTEHERAFGKAREALEHARRVGELLLQANAGIEHGAWLPWIAANCKFSARQAQRYILLAENWPAIAAKYDTASHLSMREALRLIERPRSELERANEFAIRCDAEHRDIRLRLGALRRTLDDPEASTEEISWLAREAAKLETQAHGLNVEALAGFGRCLIELKTLTGLGDDELLPMLNDGSLIRAANERIAQLEAEA